MVQIYGYKLKNRKGFRIPLRLDFGFLIQKLVLKQKDFSNLIQN